MKFLKMKLFSFYTHTVLTWFSSHRGCLGFIVVFISMFAMSAYFAHEVIVDSSIDRFRLVAIMADTCLISLPLLFLRGKWRWLWILALIIYGAFIFINILYYRNFNDLVPATLYRNNQAFDPLVVRSAVSSMKASDLTILFLCLLPIVPLVMDRNRNTTKSDVKLLFVIFISLFILNEATILAGCVYRWRKCYPDSTLSAQEIIYPSTPHNWVVYYSRTNIIGYLYRIVERNLNAYRELTESDRNTIKECLAVKSANQKPLDRIHIPENLIMIIVESLPSVALTDRNIEIVAPVISQALKDSTTIYVNRCRELAGLGRSSDGQFIYNTGLLPLKNETLVSSYSVNDYPAVAKALRLESVEVIGESKNIWSHSNTTRSYGYSRLIDGVSDNVKLDDDSVIFAAARKEINGLGNGFFMFLSSLSMHDPYDFKAVTHKLDGKLLHGDMTSDLREYWERLHHFDAALGNLILYLKKKDIYDRTVIVITGDHDIRDTKGVEALTDDAVPLIILNSPIRSEYATEATQLDVFPTILDMMGIDDYKYMGVKYTGLGKSIFRQKPGSGPEMPTDRDYEVSEMIIRRK